MKTCKSGQYYCTKDKKCKPIPTGYHVGRGGWLEKDDDSKKKNGNGNGNGHSNGNGNGSNGNGNGGNGSSYNGNGGGNGGGVSEEIEVSNWRDDFRATEYEFIDIIKPDPIVVEEPTVEWEDPTLTEAQRIQSRVGNIVRVFLRWKGRMFMLQMFFPQLKKPNRTDVIAQIQKVYPGSKLLSYDIEDYDPSEPMIQVSEGSLHKWFKGSKSKDGKAGWVNVKTGGTCASDEPGEGTPKCVSSAKRASMTKAERESASRRKKAADPNQQQKSGAAKPTYVATDKKKMKESKDVLEVAKELTKASKMHKGQADKLKKHADEMKEQKNCGCGQDPCITYGKQKKVDEGLKHVVDGERYLKLPKIYEKQAKRKDDFRSALGKAKDAVTDKLGKTNTARDGVKDSSKRIFTMQNSYEPEGKTVDEACWKGYRAKGMKKKGGKLVPNCKPIGETTDAQLKAQEKAVFELEKKEANANRAKAMKKRKEEISEEDKKGKGSGTKDACYHKVKASAKVWPSAYASGRLVQCRKKGAANYGKSKSESFSWRDEFDYVQEGAAWTKKEGKNKSGGLNEKGRKSYERDNPGSDLKAPSKKVGNPRRASFCARMKGMKKKLTSAKTARDPDSRINKSLRAWNC